MATSYLTPGVYVEEVPSANKPIEGVGTSIAAFVGLAPGGPVNRPTRISNWTQFSTIFGDAQNPENGPFMEGAYLAHAVYGFFQNGGGLCWIVRVGSADGGVRQAALPAAGDASVEAFRAIALKGVDSDVKLDLTQEAGGEGEDAPPTYKLTVTSGTDTEEYDGLSVKKGRAYIVTKVNAASKLIKLEETGGAVTDVALATGSFTLSMPKQAEGSITPSQFEGDVAKREGMGGLAAVDEVTMLICPDLMTFVNGDDVAVRDLQGKMIAHCENMGDRMAILDAPPNMIPQDILDWRMNAAGYDSKFAALYYPWLEVMDPITKRPLLVPPSGHVAGVWARTDGTRGVHKAPANEVTMGVNGARLPGHGRGAGRTEPARDQLHPGLPRPRHPHLGRPHDVERSRVALHQRPAPVQLHLGVDHGRDAVGRVRAQRRAPLELAADLGHELPEPHVAAGRALRRHSVAGVLREVRRRDQPAGRDRGRPGRDRDRDLSREAGRVRHLPHQPVRRRRERSGLSRRVREEVS